MFYFRLQTLRISQTSNHVVSYLIRNLSGAPTPRPSLTGKIKSWLGPARIQASADFNRWKLLPAAVAAHLCLGSIYSWSLFNIPLTRELGIVASSAQDWGLTDVVPVFSVVCGVHGLSAAFLGKWQEKVGPRMSVFLGGLLFGGGFIVGSAGVALHTLPLLYLGYGLMSGIGIGLAYVPPVATLLRWFPDKRGMATGLTLMGFGGGALVAAPVKMRLLNYFQSPPTKLPDGLIDNLILQDGRRYLPTETGLQEVMDISSTEAALSSFHHLDAGYYLVGTGATGVAETLACLGTAYVGVLLASALSFRNPPPNYNPQAKAKGPSSSSSAIAESPYVHVDSVMKTPQFWLQWVSFGCLATAGMGVMSVANTLMTDIFGKQLPHIVTATFASTFVMALSAANLGGRLAWASISDKIGRKKVFAVFSGLGLPLYLGIPWMIASGADGHSLLPLAGFYSSTFLLMSFFGGAYSTTPAFEADLFGSKFVGAIHGRMLTASALGAMVGPTVLTRLRQKAESDAIIDLSGKVDQSAFHAKFGTFPENIDSLIESKSVTIPQMLSLCPDSVPDPTPFLYDSTMYSAAALMVVSMLCTIAIRPVADRHLTKPSP